MKPGEFKVRVLPSEGATLKAEITMRPLGYVAPQDPPKSGTCKECGKPISDDTNGFCDLPGDPCWKAWSARLESPKQSTDPDPTPESGRP